VKRSVVCLVLLSVLAVGARAGEELAFYVEPEHGLTFSHTGELKVGSEVLLEILDLPRNQRFLANRCGHLCNTSEVVFTVTGQGLADMKRSFGIEKTARYYFYLQQVDESGAIGPVPIAGLRTARDGFEVAFEGGATVRGHVQATRIAVPGVSPSEEEGDAIEILAVSPQPLTRGVPVEVTIDVRVSLESSFEARLGVGFNGQDPVRFTERDSRIVESGTQQITVITQVIPVDWGERGDFAVSVYLLPDAKGSGPLEPLASERQSLEVVP